MFRVNNKDTRTTFYELGTNFALVLTLKREMFPDNG